MGAVTLTAVPAFIATAMCLPAMRELQDAETFSTLFLNYDRPARCGVPYGRVCPILGLFAEP